MNVISACGIWTLYMPNNRTNNVRSAFCGVIMTLNGFLISQTLLPKIVSYSSKHAKNIHLYHAWECFRNDFMPVCDGSFPNQCLRFQKKLQFYNYWHYIYSEYAADFIASQFLETLNDVWLTSVKWFVDDLKNSVQGLFSCKH